MCSSLMIDVAMEANVPCEMEDGVRLSADIYRPLEPGTYPVLLMRTPYDKTLAQSDIGYAHPSWYARRGYIVVIQDCRGRGRSEGEFFYDRSEAQDGFTTIEWAAQLPGSTGRVGMYGFSYVGYVQLLAATLRPPSLRTIAPGFIYGRMFDVIYNAGAFALGITSTAALAHAMEIARREDDDAFEALRNEINKAAESYWALPLNEYPPLQFATKSFFAEWLDHPTYDEYWQPHSVSDDYSRINVPALHVGGWYDVCLRGTLQNFLGLRAQAGDSAARKAQKLVIGPWYHMPWTDLDSLEPSEAPSRVIDDWQVRWFDHFLKDVDTDVLSTPVTAYIMGKGWADLDEWPPKDSQRTSWYLHSNGRANTAAGDGTLSQQVPASEPPDVYAYDPAFPVLSEGGHSCCWPGITPMGPQCQHGREGSRGVLVYTTSPFEQAVELIGNVDVVLFAASSAVDTDSRFGCAFRCGRLLAQPPGGHRACALPRVAGDAVSHRAREGLRVRNLALGRGNPRTAGRTAADRCHELGLSAMGPNLNTGGPIGKERLAQAIVATQLVFHNAQHPSHVAIDVREV